DKTGTLTAGEPTLRDPASVAPEALALAGAIARHSRHPLARAMARAAVDAHGPEIEHVLETPGQGLAARFGSRAVRLGSRAWCGVTGGPSGAAPGPELWLAAEGDAPVRFAFTDVLR